MRLEGDFFFFRRIRDLAVVPLIMILAKSHLGTCIFRQFRYRYKNLECDRIGCDWTSLLFALSASSSLRSNSTFVQPLILDAKNDASRTISIFQSDKLFLYYIIFFTRNRNRASFLTVNRF